MPVLNNFSFSFHNLCFTMMGTWVQSAGNLIISRIIAAEWGKKSLLTPFLPEYIEGLNSISGGFNEFMRFRSNEQTSNMIILNVRQRKRSNIFLNVFVPSPLHLWILLKTRNSYLQLMDIRGIVPWKIIPTVNIFHFMSVVSIQCNGFKQSSWAMLVLECNSSTNICDKSEICPYLQLSFSLTISCFILPP